MNTSSRCLAGLRIAALAPFIFLFAGALRADTKEKPDVPPSVLKKYDKNKDGTLDEKEAGKWEADKAERREKDRKAREERLQKYDLNKDGKLSEDELAAAKLSMGKERTERDMVKGKEKAEERIAREKEEKAEKEKQEKEAAEKAAAQLKEASVVKPAVPAEKPQEPADAKAKPGEEKPADSMMMQ